MSGFIPEEIVDRIKEDTDILDLVSDYVSLKKAGKDFIGLCPFHREKTPSFSVVPSKNFYYCFGCGASGIVVSFIMQHENLDYPDALKYLARKAGITIPEKQVADTFSGKLYRANEAALSFFKRNLKNSPAFDYLKSRDISDEMIELFGIGYAPPGWNNFGDFAGSEKIELELAEKAGLLVKSEKKRYSDYYDKFRNRVIFPIYNLSGRPVGFGGRVLNKDDAPKYLNTPETQIYHKGSLLYGLNWSKNQMRQAGKAVVVEGYFDYISLYQAGIKNIIAVSGTGFTANQAGLLGRYCKEVILLYDSDSAGMKATFRAVDVLYNAGIEPRIVRLPDGYDPDKYFNKFGAAKLAEQIENALEYIDFVNMSLPGGFSKLPINRQEKLVNSLKETASGIDDELRHTLFVKKVIETFGLTPDVAVKFKRKPIGFSPVRKSIPGGRSRFEMIFLSLLITYPEYIAEANKIIKTNNFTDTVNKEIYETLVSSESKPLTAGDLIESFTDKKIRKRIAETASEGECETPDGLFNECIDKFKSYQVSDRLADLRSKIALAEKEGNAQKSNKLNKEYYDLQSQANRKVV